MFNIEGSVAVVTGGAYGLGQVLAKGLAEAGVNVIIIDLPEAIKDVSQNEECRHTFIAADLQNISSIENAFFDIRKLFGRVDLLVNNAGINVLCPALNITEQQWDKIHSINLKASFFCAKEATRCMIQQGKGSIINIASQFGVVGYCYRAAYAASKAGLIGLTRSLAVEWAQYRIRVNSISPTILKKDSNAWLLEDEEFKLEMLPRIPLGRFGNPEDILGAVIFLASEESSMITGHNLIVDGGWTAM